MAISLKVGSQYVCCVGGTNCKLSSAFSAASCVHLFRKGYEGASGANTGIAPDNNTPYVNGEASIWKIGSAKSYQPTLDCAESTCTYQNHAGIYYADILLNFDTEKCNCKIFSKSIFEGGRGKVIK